jgi:hypothetical protein
VDAQQLIGEPPCCRTGLACRGQDQVDVPFQAHALNRDEPQNAVWCGQHRVLQADWSEADPARFDLAAANAAAVSA